jgi:CIC family chloride channel protein
MDERLLLMLVGLGVGLCAGLAAFGLNHAIEAIHHALHGLRHAWWALFIPGIGAALSWIFLTQIARDRPGHGVPEVILSVTRDGGRLRFRSSFSRLVSSALTIGSGGSAGPEAPVVMSGSAIGSSIARVLRLNEQQRIVLVGCGAAAAIASIFNAPIAGMVFTLEVILGEWRRIHIAPIAIASVAGAALSRFLRGDQIPFDHGGFAIGLGEILASPGLALATALLSVLLTRLIARSHGLWQRLPVPGWLRAGLGGCLVGAIALAFPVVLGEGYTDIRTMIGGEFSAGIAIVAAAVLAKAVATSLTLGSGGSGGIFAPSLVVGAMVGLTYQRALVHLWPGLPLVNEGCFALLGMAGMVSGILQAPLTGIFLILEITGGYDVMLPLMVGQRGLVHGVPANRARLHLLPGTGHDRPTAASRHRRPGSDRSQHPGTARRGLPTRPRGRDPAPSGRTRSDHAAELLRRRGSPRGAVRGPPPPGRSARDPVRRGSVRRRGGRRGHAAGPDHRGAG